MVFARPIIKETVTPTRWAAMYLGLFGTYRKNETVDVEYTRRRPDQARRGRWRSSRTPSSDLTG